MNCSTFVWHLLCTRDDSNPWKYSGEQDQYNLCPSTELKSIGAWTDGTQVNKDNFKYSCHSIIIIKLVVNIY